MCGIVGAIGQRDVARVLIQALKRLEYRGYDSAGVAVLNADNHIQRIRTVGKVHELEAAMNQENLLGHVGIAHTRWATHGKPSETNAHPHMSGEIALVHNGIVENHQKFRKDLIAAGYAFQSETDTEVVAHLLHQYLSTGEGFLDAVKNVMREIEGAFAIVFMYTKEPDRLIAVRRGPPLVIGVGMGEHFIASDYVSLLPFTDQFIFLEDGDIADVTRKQIKIYDQKGMLVEREVHQLSGQQDAIDRGKYRHYMQKEIFEQPALLRILLKVV